MRYTPKAHGDYLAYLIRQQYFRVLLAAYAFFVFFGVMPKAPPRSPFQSQFEYMFDTVSRSLGGFVTLAVLLAIVCAIWAGIAAAQGHKVPSDKESDGTLI